MFSSIDKELLPLKLLYVFVLSIYSIILLYVSPFLIQWGITVSELAILTFSAHILTFFTRPLFGFIADRYQDYKKIIVVTACGSAILFFLHLAAPKNIPKVLSYSIVKNFHLSKNNKISSLGICVLNISGICWPSNMSNCAFSGLSKINLTHHYNNETCAFYRFDSANQSNYNNAPLSNSLKCLNVDQNCGNNSQSHVFFEIYEKISLTWSSTFWILGILKILSFAIYSPLSNLTDSLIFLVLGQNRSNEYSYMRMFGTIGVLMFSIITGLSLFMMDILSTYSSWIAKIQLYSQFSICFLLQAVALTIVIVVIYFIELKKSSEEKLKYKKKSCWSKFLDATSLKFVCSNVELTIFFLFVILGGSVVTVHIEYYMLVIYRKFPTAPKFLPGLLISFMMISEITVLGVSGKMFNYFRYEILVSATFVFWFFRWLLYSFLDKYWQFLILELIHGTTFGLQFSAMVTYIGKTTSSSAQGRIQGLFSSLFFNIGGCLGGLVGGIILDNYGMNGLFRSMSVISLILGLIYYPLQVWLIPRCCKTSLNKPIKNEEGILISEDLEIKNVESSLINNDR